MLLCGEVARAGRKLKLIERRLIILEELLIERERRADRHEDDDKQVAQCSREIIPHVPQKNRFHHIQLQHFETSPNNLEFSYVIADSRLVAPNFRRPQSTRENNARGLFWRPFRLSAHRTQCVLR